MNIAIIRAEWGYREVRRLAIATVDFLEKIILDKKVVFLNGSHK